MLWLNDWKRAGLLYGIPILFAILDDDPHYRVLVVASIWLVATADSLNYAESSSALRTTLLSAALQLAALLWGILAALGWGVTFASWWMPMAALAGAIPLTVLCEARLSRPLPRYCFELLAITVASLLYLTTRAFWPSQTVLGILVANLTVFVIGVSRSSRLQLERGPSPEQQNNQILETWRVRLRSGSRFRLTVSALITPIGLVGLVLIAGESLLLVLGMTKGI